MSSLLFEKYTTIPSLVCEHTTSHSALDLDHCQTIIWHHFYTIYVCIQVQNQVFLFRSQKCTRGQTNLKIGFGFLDFLVSHHIKHETPSVMVDGGSLAGVES